MIHFVFIGCAASSFPISVIQAEGVDTVFLCQHPTGIFLQNTDTRNGLIRSEGHSAAVEALIITAVSQYNSAIVCLTLILLE